MENDIELDDIQVDAIVRALTEKIIIITGSPGTGKSTILNFIIKILEQEKKKVLMAAPNRQGIKKDDGDNRKRIKDNTPPAGI